MNFLQLPKVEDLRNFSDLMAQKRKAQEAFGAQKSEFIRRDLIVFAHIIVRSIERFCCRETCKAIRSLVASATHKDR